MKGTRLSVLLGLLLSAGAMAETMHQDVSPGKLVVQVKGVVCSFCAYGTEKNLAKLEFLDLSQYGDGVLIDINTHRITLALQPNKPVRYAGIADAIVKGGYDPVIYHVALKGVIREHQGHYQLICEENGQVYTLPPSVEAAPLLGKQILVRAELNAEQAANAVEGQPIRLTKIKLEPQP